MKLIMALNICLLTLLIVASVIASSSSTARCGSTIPKGKFGPTNENQELYSSEGDDDEIYKQREDIIHERLLRANTKDYGRPDPTPTFVKPPFKLIPN